MALSEPAEYGQPDFILVDEISEESFLANLKLRYEKGRVRESVCYTRCAVKEIKNAHCIVYPERQHVDIIILNFC